MWVHGTAVRPTHPGGAGLEGENGYRLTQVNGKPWTDITGLAYSTEMIFEADANNANDFVFSIPSPVWRAAPKAIEESRAVLLSAFVLYDADPGVHVQTVTLTDGARPFVDSRGNPIGSFNVSQGGGSSFPTSIVNGKTKWTIDRDPFVAGSTPGAPIFFGLSIQVHVSWTLHGQLRFTAAGADFLVQS